VEYKGGVERIPRSLTFLSSCVMQAIRIRHRHDASAACMSVDSRPIKMLVKPHMSC
jgi:hypothetical protein